MGMIYTEERVREATLSYFDGDELATNVFMSKYCLRDRVGNFLELTPDDMHRRMAKEFYKAESVYGSYMTEEEIYNLFKDFRYIVPGGSIMSGLGDDGRLVSLSNCTVIKPPEDSITSIMDTGRDMANLFKARCGVGTDLSQLRPHGYRVNNSAKSSTGAWSFANYYSEVTKSIGQSGRRGALMVSMDVSHPDIFKFVTCKKDLSKVTGANISVKIDDEFMMAVMNDDKYMLRWKECEVEIDALELWNTIVSTATTTAEPGILFWDHHLDYNPTSVYDELRPCGTNPCGELPLSDGDACRLMACNLVHFVENPFTDKARFNYEELRDRFTKLTRLGDDLVDLELDKIKLIMDKARAEGDVGVLSLWDKFLKKGEQGRRLGLGVLGLADTLASLKLRYDSNLAITEVDKIFKTILETTYETSIQLAKERGPFPLFDWEKEKDNEFIKSLPQKIRHDMAQYGRRNSTLLTCAPTGSGSLLAKVSSGIEPVFQNDYKRRRKLDSSVTGEGIITMADGQKFEEYVVYHHNVQDFINNHNNGDKELPDYFVTSADIDWRQRVKIQATIQRYIDSSISSTINLPRGTSSSVVGDIYLEAWKQKLKGVTVYVEGSREGVLVATDTEEERKYHDPIRRPDELECEIHHTSVKGEKWVVFVGMLNDKPYEVFGGLSEYIDLSKKYTSGHIVKRTYKTKHNRYDLIINKDREDEITIKNIVKMFENPNHGVLGRLISLSLRHGARSAYVTDQLFKDTEFDFTTYSKVMGRILKKYIGDGEEPETEEHCKDCGGKMIFQGGCKECEGCGNSYCSG